MKIKLQEDKIIAKEDEAGVPMGGEMASSDSSIPSSETIDSHAGGVSSAEILGHCDHEHDHHGFFHKGCLHLPYPIFSIPLSRIPKKKKKKKYIKVLDLTESDEYTQFNSISKDIIDSIVSSINNELQKINNSLKVIYDTEIKFENQTEHWFSVLVIKGKELHINLNLPEIYQMLEENDLINDKTEIKCQIQASLYHEVGHGIIKYFESTDIFDFEVDQDKEEKVVQDFVNYKMREFTHVMSSKL